MVDNKDLNISIFLHFQNIPINEIKCNPYLEDHKLLLLTLKVRACPHLVGMTLKGKNEL